MKGKPKGGTEGHEKEKDEKWMKDRFTNQRRKRIEIMITEKAKFDA